MLKHKQHSNAIIGHMSKSQDKEFTHVKPKFSSRAVTGVVVVFILVVIVAIIWASAPHPSVAAYCKVYKQEKSRLTKLPGDTYPSVLFDHPLSDAGKFATSLGRLEKVAPNDIRPDVKTLKSLYDKLDKDPSQLVSVSFTAETVDKNVSDWTSAHCGSDH